MAAEMAMMCLWLMLLAAFLECRALVSVSRLLATKQGHRPTTLILLHSEPSDVESAESAAWTAAAMPMQQQSAYNAPKEFLLDGSARLTRSEINEYVLALEKLNPTPEPATSRFLNGVWEVKSTGFGSPGLVGLQVLKALSSEIVDMVTVTISSVAPRVVATTTIKVASAKVEFAVTTDLETMGPNRLKETVSSVRLGSLDVPLSTLTSSLPALVSRDIFITYLDEDLLVARDTLGTPEILTRKMLQLRDSSGGAPSASGDDGAPGA